MRGKNEILCPEKTIGSLPGIDVGYQFYSRAEMTADGFHSHWLNGIDYIRQSKGKKLLTVITTIDDLNYPENTDTYYIVNAPYIFSSCWKETRLGWASC
ncbi:histone-lysine N-methyltransferase, H3 lysine-9 specific SUVH4-like isoform X3 [Chenopodium quinoa]|uniref:histone-lysine N-methyltransferase, H3 lysine-9 specific SUVH4-like isoform X3 n=1 Tax=Chenopodium quinoa TaxID=63459 RepID=UPI000B78CB6C|nr:histone-lysine N-methyltransferase, H3 lysine-9 specific SUVH4-like isoform X3 [Chenopodium quinoa]